MDYDFLKKLIVKVEEFEQHQQGTEPKTLEHFATWLAAERPVQAVIESVMDGGIGELIVLMYRYAKNYTKKALKNTPIQTLDEFTYMATLMENPLTKTQVIEKQAQEKTTGMAIIQRLLRKGWVVESDNEADGRSQIIHLTDAGLNILRGGFFEMTKVSRIVAADLTEDEQTELTRILKKLDAFHRTVFDKEKSTNIDNIIEKYIA